MCSSSGSSGPSPADISLQEQQMAAAQNQSDAAIAEQQREFNVNQQEQATTLANTQALQAQNQAAADQQAALTNTWETGRAAEQQTATNDVTGAFAAFTPDYYKSFTDAYVNHYQPQIDQQFGTASNQTDFGLARTGNLDSQTAADQFASLNEQKGTAEADMNNQAIGATNTLETNVTNAENNLMSQATSDATLGSPITPGSADAVTADFNNTAQALNNLSTTAGDTVSSLPAAPTYSSLGSLFSTAASTGSAAVSGNNAYTNYQAFNAALGGGVSD